MELLNQYEQLIMNITYIIKSLQNTETTVICLEGYLHLYGGDFMPSCFICAEINPEIDKNLLKTSQHLCPCYIPSITNDEHVKRLTKYLRNLKRKIWFDFGVYL